MLTSFTYTAGGVEIECHKHARTRAIVTRVGNAPELALVSTDYPTHGDFTRAIWRQATGNEGTATERAEFGILCSIMDGVYSA